VKARRLAGVKSISEALDNQDLWPAPPPPADTITVPVTLGSNILEGPQTEVAESFEVAANEILTDYPAKAAKKFPELLHWKIATDNALKQTSDRSIGIKNTRLRG